MANESLPLFQEIEQCLAELHRAHSPVAEWIASGLRCLGKGKFSHRDLRKAERDCTRHLAALQDNREVLHLMEARYPDYAASFAQARAGVDLMTARLQAFLKRIRDQRDVLPDRPLYVVDVPIEELNVVVEAYSGVVQEQEQDFAFFKISPDFMDGALLQVELDAIEDGCDEHEGLAYALEAKVGDWRAIATEKQSRLLAVCDDLVSRLRFVQASKRQAIAKLRDSTAEAAIGLRLKELADETTGDGAPSPVRLH